MLAPGKRKRDTNAIGEISESAIATRFLQLGYMLLLPYGGNQRYDDRRRQGGNMAHSV
jgi:hypothetical protein